MNTQKLIAIAGAIAINCAVLAAFHAWTTVQVASAHPVPAAIHGVVTLPAINVHPTAAQRRELRRERADRESRQTRVGGGGLACVDMPYYSFAGACGDAAVG